MMTELERAIVATVACAKVEGLEATSLYLSPEDFAELDRLGLAGGIERLTVKRTAGKSRIYCRGGIARHVTLRQPARMWKPSPEPAR